MVRSTDPDPRTWAAPWRRALVDEDPPEPGVQWTDTGAAVSPHAPFFYSIEGESPVPDNLM